MSRFSVVAVIIEDKAAFKGHILTNRQIADHKNRMRRILDNIIVFEQDGFAQDGAKISLRTRANLLGTLRRRKRA